MCWKPKHEKLISIVKLIRTTNLLFDRSLKDWKPSSSVGNMVKCNIPVWAPERWHVLNNTQGEQVYNATQYTRPCLLPTVALCNWGLNNSFFCLFRKVILFDVFHFLVLFQIFIIFIKNAAHFFKKTAHFFKKTHHFFKKTHHFSKKTHRFFKKTHHFFKKTHHFFKKTTLFWKI